MIYRPLGYDRESRRARRVMLFATLFAVTIHLPLTVAHFMFLFPDNLKSTIIDAVGGDVERGTGAFDFLMAMPMPVYYMSSKASCYRYFIAGSLDEGIIVNSLLALHFLALALVLLSFVAILHVILQSRKQFKVSSFRRREQNRRVGSTAILATSFTLLPWLPNVVTSLALRVESNYQWLLQQPSDHYIWNLIDATNYLYYLVPGIFPVLCMFSNPALVRIRVALVKQVIGQKADTKSTVAKSCVVVQNTNC